MNKKVNFFVMMLVFGLASAMLSMNPLNALTVAKRLVATGDFGNDLASGASWTNFCGTYTMDGTWVKLVNTSTTDTNSACKVITLNQTTAKMLRLTGASKADSVTDYIDPISYSLRVDVTYMDDSTDNYTHTPYSSGTHDWESAELFFFPKKPVKSAKIIVTLYWRTGTVWFKDVTLQEQNASGPFGKFDDTGIKNETATEGYLVREFAAGEDWYEIADSGSGNDWSLAASSTQNNGITIHTATLTDNSGSERAGVLAYRIPLSGAGLKWCDADLRTESTTDLTFNEYRNEIDSKFWENVKSRPKFLWGCVVNDTNGYAIAIDPDYPVQFRIRYESNTKELFVVFDLGFNSTVTQATVKFIVWNFTPVAGTAGMRQVIRAFYNLYPDAFRDRIVEAGGAHGNWFIKDLSGFTIPNPQDFGLRYNQNNTSAASMAYDEANLIFDTVYVHPWELFIDISGLEADPTYEDVIAELNQLAAYGDPTALAIQNSGVKDKNGQYIYHIGALWSPDYARFIMNAAPGVGLPGRNAYYDQWTDSSVQDYLTPGTMDGIMCDNVESPYWYSCAEKTRINYDASHFGDMETPLVHDKNGKVGICYEMMIWEYFNSVRDDILPANPPNSYDNKLLIMQANGIPYNTTFIATKLDIPGGEQSWDPANPGWNPLGEADLLRFRAQAGRKLVTFLHNMNDITTWSNAKTRKYFARCCAFGIMPSFFMGGSDPSDPRYFDYASGGEYYYERDRALFQQYMPVIRKLSEAGWEPVREATVNDSEVFLERFGSEYLTVFNPTANSKNVTVAYMPTAMTITGKELISGNNVAWTNGQASFTVGSEEVAVLEIPTLIGFEFNEGSGTSVAAESPYDNITGTFSASGVSWVEGIRGDALDFDGGNGYVQVSDNDIFDIGDSGLTYAAWIKADTLNPSGHSMVMCKASGQYMSIVSKYLYFKLTTDGTQQRYCSGNTQIQTDVWSHIAATYNREGYMKVFINGRQNGNTAGPFLNPVNNTSYIRIGVLSSSGWFDGIIDDLRISRKGCTDKEIRKLKDWAIVAYSFPLDEGTGITAKDNFDDSRQATISGATWHGNITLDKKDNALYFDGVDDYATITDGSSFKTDGANGFTFAAWIKAVSPMPDGHNMVMSKGQAYLSINAGKILFKMLTDPPTNNQRYCWGKTSLYAETWCHVAAVYEMPSGNMKVYLNGTLDQTVTYPNPSNVAGSLLIGKGANAYFGGIISNVRIYNRGLTADEINLLYENEE